MRTTNHLRSRTPPGWFDAAQEPQLKTHSREHGFVRRDTPTQHWQEIQLINAKPEATNTRKWALLDINVYIFDTPEKHIPPSLVPECFHVFCTTDHFTMNTVHCKTVTQWTRGAVGRLQNGKYVNDEAWINPEINLLHFEMFIWFQPYNIISSLIIDDIKSSYRFRYSPST